MDLANETVAQLQAQYKEACKALDEQQLVLDAANAKYEAFRARTAKQPKTVMIIEEESSLQKSVEKAIHLRERLAIEQQATKVAWRKAAARLESQPKKVATVPAPVTANGNSSVPCKPRKLDTEQALSRDQPVPKVTASLPKPIATDVEMIEPQNSLGEASSSRRKRDFRKKPAILLQIRFPEDYDGDWVSDRDEWAQRWIIPHSTAIADMCELWTTTDKSVQTRIREAMRGDFPGELKKDGCARTRKKHETLAAYWKDYDPATPANLIGWLSILHIVLHQGVKIPSGALMAGDFVGWDVVMHVWGTAINNSDS